MTPGPDYLIQTGDELDVRFPFQPEMNEAAPVRPDGRITLVATGEIAAVGLTTTALEAKIIAAGAAHFRNPQVTVVVTRPGQHFVYVGGEVARPGAIVLVPGMTLLQALVNSGGFRTTARRDSVLLIVPAPGGTFSTARVNMEAIVDANALERVRLQANDVIFVPKTWIAGMDDVVNLYVTGLIPGMPNVGVGYSISR
jgi:protein involved in polysaccharide export with SLBB domain